MFPPNLQTSISLSLQFSRRFDYCESGPLVSLVWLLAVTTNLVLRPSENLWRAGPSRTRLHRRHIRPQHPVLSATLALDTRLRVILKPDHENALRVLHSASPLLLLRLPLPLPLPPRLRPPQLRAAASPAPPQLPERPLCFYSKGNGKKRVFKCWVCCCT